MRSMSQNASMPRVTVGCGQPSIEIVKRLVLVLCCLSGCGFSLVSGSRATPTRVVVRPPDGGAAEQMPPCMPLAWPLAALGGIVVMRWIRYEDAPQPLDARDGHSEVESLARIGALLLAMPTAVLFASSIYGFAKRASC
jgi:hypothetical protein